jgi:hypothetical protein
VKGHRPLFERADPSVEGVCEDASDAGGTVTDAGERGITILARPLAFAPGDLQSDR